MEKTTTSGFASFAFLLVASLSCASEGGEAAANTPSATTATGSCPGGALSADEYKVLAAVIKTHFLEGAQRLIVIDRTGGGAPEMITSQPDFAMPPEAVADFGGKNKETACVESAMDVGMPATVVPQADVDAFFADDVVAGWPKFYEKYPGAQGIMKVTRPGFAAGGSQAVVFISNSKQALNAEGTVFLLQKQGDTWTVTGARTIWIS